LTAPPARKDRSLRRRDPVELAERVLGGERAALPRLLSVIEQGGEPARAAARLLFPRGGSAYTVGITGPPGAGKSTLADRMISFLRAQGTQVAVLAVDPTSPFSGGALLGDRVRMMDHALDDGVFVRSMATRGHLGGLSLAAPEAIRALDAAGFPVVLVETVGVGQVEVEVAGAADTTVVVLNPGSGDGVQASKAGLLEVADIFVINKADRPGVAELQRDLEFTIHLSAGGGEAPIPQWTPPILRAVAATGSGTAELVQSVADHRAMLERTGGLAQRRAHRLAVELNQILAARLERRAADLIATDAHAALLADVEARRVDPYTAADRILESVGG
jgi:LAO/AO transport system kinase